MEKSRSKVVHILALILVVFFMFFGVMLCGCDTTSNSNGGGETEVEEELQDGTDDGEEDLDNETNNEDDAEAQFSSGYYAVLSTNTTHASSYSYDEYYETDYGSSYSGTLPPWMSVGSAGGAPSVTTFSSPTVTKSGTTYTTTEVAGYTFVGWYSVSQNYYSEADTQYTGVSATRVSTYLTFDNSTTYSTLHAVYYKGGVLTMSVNTVAYNAPSSMTIAKSSSSVTLSTTSLSSLTSAGYNVTATQTNGATSCTITFTLGGSSSYYYCYYAGLGRSDDGQTVYAAADVLSVSTVITGTGSFTYSWNGAGKSIIVYVYQRMYLKLSYTVSAANAPTVSVTSSQSGGFASSTTASSFSTTLTLSSSSVTRYYFWIYNSSSTITWTVASNSSSYYWYYSTTSSAPTRSSSYVGGSSGGTFTNTWAGTSNSNTIYLKLYQRVSITLYSRYTTNYSSFTTSSTGGTLSLTYSSTSVATGIYSTTVYFVYNSAVTVAPTANSGYSFVGLYTTSTISSASSSDVSSSYSITLSSATTTRYGFFVRYVTDTYGAYYTSDYSTFTLGTVGGKVSLAYTTTYNTTATNTTATSGTGSVQRLYGSTATLTATETGGDDCDGYLFAGWMSVIPTSSNCTSSSSYTSTDSSITLSSGTGYTRYAVFVKYVTDTFAPYYTSDYSTFSNGTTGGTTTFTYKSIWNDTTTASSGTVYRLNESTATLKATETDGYLFVGWVTSVPTSSNCTGSSSFVSTSSSYSFGEDFNYTLYAVFVRYVSVEFTAYYTSDYSTFSSGSTGGTLSLTYKSLYNASLSETTDSDGVDRLYGSTATLTATAASGYTFVGWMTAIPTSSNCTGYSSFTSTSSPLTLSAGTAYTRYAVFVRYVALNTGAYYTEDYSTFTNGSTGGTVSYTYTVYNATSSATSSKSSYTRLYGVAGKLTPTAASGYTFVGWMTAVPTSSNCTSSSSFSSTSSSLTLAAGTVYTYYAVFVRYISSTFGAYYTEDYSTFTNGSTGGTVKYTYTVYNATSSAVSSNTSYTRVYGKDGTLTPTAASGYTFVGWMTKIPTSSNCTGYSSFTSTSSSLTLEASTVYTYYAVFVRYVSVTFGPYYTSDYSTFSNGTTGGTVSLSYTSVYNASSTTSSDSSSTIKRLYSSTATLTPTATSGYTFVGWMSAIPTSSNCTGSSSFTSTSNPLSLSSGTGYTRYAVFVRYVTATIGAYYTSTYTSFSSGTTGGTISLSYTTVYNASGSTSSTVNRLYSSTATLSATAASGYVFAGWMTAIPTSSNCTGASSFTSTSSSISLSTGTAYTRYAVFVRYVALNTGAYYTEDYSTFTNGSTGGTVSYTYTVYNATSSAISSKSSYTRLYGVAGKLTATAASGYTFVGWMTAVPTSSNCTSSSSFSSTSSSLTLEAGKEYTYYAVFVRYVSSTFGAYYTEDYSTFTNGSTGGTVKYTYTVYNATSSAVSSNTSYTRVYGKDGTLTATAASGYKFVGWMTEVPTSSNCTGSSSFTSTDSSLTLEASKVYTYYAVFVRYVTATIGRYYTSDYSTFTSGTTGGTISLSYKTVYNATTTASNGSATRLYGSTATLTASAASGYAFAGWMTSVPSASTCTSSSSYYSTDSSLTLSTGTTYTYYAVFVQYVTTTIGRYYTDDYADFTSGETGGTVTLTYTNVYNEEATATNGSVKRLYSTTADLKPSVASGYVFAGWMTAIPTSSNCTGSSSFTTTTGSITLSSSASSTRYGVFVHYVSATIAAYYTLDGYSTFTKGTACGTVSISYTTVYNASGTSSSTVSRLYATEATLTATPASGYSFAGWMNVAPTSSNCTGSTFVSTSSTITLASKTAYTRYAIFVPDLSYDGDGNYWYFEDGEYPQTYYGSSAPSGISSTASYTLTVDGTSVPVYTSTSGTKYAKMTLNGTTAWFIVEPIKWICMFGSSYSTDWMNNTSFVSANVVVVGSVSSNSVATGWDWTESDLFNEVSVLESSISFSYGSSTSRTYDLFTTISQSFVTQDATSAKTILTVSSVDEIDEYAGGYAATCTDFVAFVVSGGTTTTGGMYLDYWTRDLAAEVDSSSAYYSEMNTTYSYSGIVNNGVYVSASGLLSNSKLQYCMGARLTLSASF